jgi:hypothetical protein
LGSPISWCFAKIADLQIQKILKKGPTALLSLLTNNVVGNYLRRGLKMTPLGWGEQKTLYFNIFRPQKPPPTNWLSKQPPQESAWTQETGCDLDSVSQTQIYFVGSENHEPMPQKQPKAKTLAELNPELR